jgi:hypothetical protein
MKILSLIFSLIILASGLYAELRYENMEPNLQISFENDEELSIREDIYTTIAFPSDEVIISNPICEVVTISADGEILRTEMRDASDLIEITHSFVMREMQGHTIRLSVAANESSEIIRTLSFTLEPTGTLRHPSSVSPAFLPLYDKLADNFENSYLWDTEVRPSAMLIITPDALAPVLSSYTDWVNAKGIRTQVATMSEAGTTSNQIKSYIESVYYSDFNPDFLLLIGDVDNPYNMPSFYFGDANNVTDHPYTLIESDDYFPDMLVGRFSVDNMTELQTIIAKTLYYEKEPYMDNTDWYESALLVAGDYASSPPIPTTPGDITRMLRDWLYDYGYHTIHSVFYPGHYYPPTPIINAINEGVSMATYRGWGDANGWHYPYFHNENIDELNNGRKLPIVTSIVCNTGDFANSVDPAFGEKWLRVGTPTNPKGAVAFVGPSDLHTSTRFNNSIFSGIYYGLLAEDIFTFGSAVLRGKIELYQNFVNQQGSGQWVEFYFHVYNILGDPSLSWWTKVPQPIEADVPSEVSIAQNYVDISVAGLDGGIVTAIKEDEFYDVQIIEDGMVTMYLSSQTEGTIDITITKPNYHPEFAEIEVVSQSIDIGLVEFEPLSEVLSGLEVDLSLSLKNFGTELATDVSAELSSNSPYVSISEPIMNYGDIAAGAVVDEVVSVQISPDCPEQHSIEFVMDINDEFTSKFYLIVGGLYFQIEDITVLDHGGILEIGEESDIRVSFKNMGSVDAIGLEAELETLTEAGSVVNGSSVVGDVNIGESGEAEFTLFIESDCARGRMIPMEITFIDDIGRTTTAFMTMEAGLVDNTAPTGPDSRGYYAYDSYDTDYEHAPSYFWYDIDPYQGGNGDVIYLTDDTSETIPLPFDFTYYGVEFDSVTVCDNGWMSFGTTWHTWFRNWPIPAAFSPPALVAPFWNDLIGPEISQGNHEEMRIVHYYDQTENLFVISWENCVSRIDNETPQRFQVILYDPAYHSTPTGDGEIQFNYHTIDNNAHNSCYSTVGIQNLYRSDGIEYTYCNYYPDSATPLENGLAIKFTTHPPDSYTSADDIVIDPSSIKLGVNYPNPFNPSTTISYSLPNEAQVSLAIYNIKGELVKILVDQPIQAGHHEAVWDGRNMRNREVSSGVYFYQLTVDGQKTDIKKCLLLK